MKITKSIYILIGLVFASIVFYACKKNFLDKPALGSFAPTTLANQAGVQGLLIGAYSMMDGIGDNNYTNFDGSASNWVMGDMASDDAYKGSDPNDGAVDVFPIETYTATGTNDAVRYRWNALFDGIQRANDVLRIMAQVTDITDADKITITAEARFLRGFYHFEAKKIWNMIPYIDETISYANGNTDVPNDKDIYPQIEADLQYAGDNLPNDWSGTGEIGRANKWAAKCFLAKVYLFDHKYAEAKTLFDDVITNGVTASGAKYALMPLYHDNFNAATKNNAEAVLSVQQSINDGSGGNNAGWGDVLTFPNSPAPVGNCCNFRQPTQNLVNAFKTDAATGLPLLDNFNDVDVKNDLGIESSAPFTPETGTLDPRLDWTVTRRGIPFLDWGLNPGKYWIRDQSNGGPYLAIKRIYEQKQKDTYVDKTFWTNGVSANNYVLLRFADVLLMAAECEIEAGSMDKAREYVNMVRTRAANPDGWVHTYIDNNDPLKGFTTTPAANYKIGLYNTPWANKEYALKAVRFERRLELALEGHRFFDLVRYGTAATVLNNYIAKEKKLHSYLNAVSFVAGKSEYFPIPQSEIDKANGALKQNPGY